jgi:RNA recognition motif-containing protein
VENVHHLVDENLLKILFEPFGIIRSISIYRNGSLPGRAYIEFLHLKSVELAVSNMQHFSLVLIY